MTCMSNSLKLPSYIFTISLDFSLHWDDFHTHTHPAVENLSCFVGGEGGSGGNGVVLCAVREEGEVMGQHLLAAMMKEALHLIYHSFFPPNILFIYKENEDQRAYTISLKTHSL